MGFARTTLELRRSTSLWIQGRGLSLCSSRNGTQRREGVVEEERDYARWLAGVRIHAWSHEYGQYRHLGSLHSEFPRLEVWRRFY